MTLTWNTLHPLTPLSLAAVLMLTLDSCSSSHGIKGIPQTLPPISAAGSTNTPPHHMASYQYPFDSNGRYVTAWAAEGERRAGRTAAASSDTRKWSSSHGGSVSSKSRSSSGTKSKSATASKSSSGSGASYIVKSGDTLSGLASRYGTTVTKIKSANGLSSTMIRIGQKLRIPR